MVRGRGIEVQLQSRQLGPVRNIGDVLCEIHDEEELQHAVDAGCDLIGVNNRDLRTFAVDLETAFRLAPSIPKNVMRVAESGIHSGTDIARLRAAGYQAFLIGESLMKAKSPGDALRTLMVEATSGQWSVVSGQWPVASKFPRVRRDSVTTDH